MDNGLNNYRRFLAGDDEGIVEIIRHYKDGLTLYINGYVNNIFIAEDLMEETFFRLLVKKPKFTGKYSFKTWLYTVGRNTAIDYIRHNKRLTVLPNNDFEAYLLEEQSVERVYLREERKIAVHRALRSLKAEYRQILYLKYFEGFNNSEAAVIMKRSNRQIENLAYRARISLRSELEKGEFFYEEL